MPRRENKKIALRPYAKLWDEHCEPCVCMHWQGRTLVAMTRSRATRFVNTVGPQTALVVVRELLSMRVVTCIVIRLSSIFRSPPCVCISRAALDMGLGGHDHSLGCVLVVTQNRSPHMHPPCSLCVSLSPSCAAHHDPSKTRSTGCSPWNRFCFCETTRTRRLTDEIPQSIPEVGAGGARFRHSSVGLKAMHAHVKRSPSLCPLNHLPPWTGMCRNEVCDEGVNACS